MPVQDLSLLTADSASSYSHFHDSVIYIFNLHEAYINNSMTHMQCFLCLCQQLAAKGILHLGCSCVRDHVLKVRKT